MARIDVLYHSSERVKVNISQLGWPCVMGALILMNVYVSVALGSSIL